MLAEADEPKFDHLCEVLLPDILFCVRMVIDLDEA